jgi:antitoxin HigA-1
MIKRHASIEPTHPGKILHEDAFPALTVTTPALAEALGVSRQTLHEIMTLKRGVSPEMAIRLEAVMGSTASTRSQAARRRLSAQTATSFRL